MVACVDTAPNLNRLLRMRACRPRRHREVQVCIVERAAKEARVYSKNAPFVLRMIKTSERSTSAACTKRRTWAARNETIDRYGGQTDKETVNWRKEEEDGRMR